MTRHFIIPILAALGIFAFALPHPGEPTAQDKQLVAIQQTLVTFNGTIAPLLRENCTPCHFKGGKMYDRLPFERYDTVRTLGKKLNTRLKGEKADLVNRWIEQGYPK